MCYLNHTNQTLHKFYYFVLLLRVLILLNYFVSMSRNVVAAAADAAYCSLHRLLVPFADWSRRKDKKKRNNISSSGDDGGNKTIRNLLIECVFGVSMCVLCALLSSAWCARRRYVLTWFSKFGFVVDRRTTAQHSRLQWVWMGQFNLSRRRVDCLMPYVWTATTTAKATIHVVFLLRERQNQVRFLFSFFHSIDFTHTWWELIEAASKLFARAHTNTDIILPFQ